MVQFIYSDDYYNLFQNFEASKQFDFHVNMFMMGDKYDVEKLRTVAAAWWNTQARVHISDALLPLSIQRICGPSAVQFADHTLEQLAFRFCEKNLKHCLENATFLKLLKEGSLLDAHFTRLLLAHAANMILNTNQKKRLAG